MLIYAIRLKVCGHDTYLSLLNIWFINHVHFYSVGTLYGYTSLQSSGKAFTRFRSLSVEIFKHLAKRSFVGLGIDFGQKVTGLQLTFQFIPRVFNRDEARALCRLLKFHHTMSSWIGLCAQGNSHPGKEKCLSKTVATKLERSNGLNWRGML